MFRLVDYFILLYATVLAMTLKSLVFVFNKVHFIIDRDISNQFCFQVDGLKN